MPQFLSPDVYESEVQGKTSSVPPAGTSAFSMAGYSTRGPENKALVSTSFADYGRQFGGFSNKSFNTYQANAYFQNGGNQLWFVRKLHSDAVAAQGSVANLHAVASGRGIWANEAEVVLAGEPSYYDPTTATYSRFSLSISILDQITGLLDLEETYDYLVLDNANDPNYILSIINNESSDVVLNAISGPVVGIPAALQPTSFNTNIGAGDGSNFSFTGSVSGSIPVAPGIVTATVSGVAVAVDDGQGNFIQVSGGPSVSGTIDYASGNVSIFINPAPAISAAVNIVGKQVPNSSLTITLSSGLDGSAVTSADIVNVANKLDKQGLYAFDDVDIQMQLGLPDYAGDATTDQALIDYAEGRGDVLSILSPRQGTTPQNAVAYRRNTLKSQSSYACMYYPWVKVADPLNNNYPKLMPPIGHAAGRMAFTDISENVGKAPAGITRGQLSYIIGVERVLSKNERDLLYPAQINMIRSDASVGTALWGNKTLQIVGDYTDINIRRTFISLEKEQYTALLAYNFENVGPAEFAVIQVALSLYLENKFLQGVIGSGVPTSSQAYKVVCDETNNTQATQLQKIIIIDEYIKPNLAAEFIWLRLQRVFDASQV